MFKEILILFALCIIKTLAIVNSVECSSEDGTFSIVCPESDDPPDFSKCCWNQTTVHCCPHHISLEDISDTTVMVTGLIVISSCIFMAITIVICCFWSRCLLFNMCRVNYTYGNIIAYTKEEAFGSLPYEGNCKTYTPCQVNIKPVQEF